MNADALSRNPIDLDDIRNDGINNKNSIEINLIEQRNAKRISDFKCKKKVPETNLTCYEKIDNDVIEGNIEESNFKESKQFINENNISKNKNNRRNCDGLKYKAIEDVDTGYSYLRGNEEVLINDGNSIKKMKNKEQNDDINNEDIEKQKICENYEKIKELYEGTLFENINKRFYDDFNEGKIDGNDTEEIKQLLKEEYLLKNDDDNDGKSCIEFDFKNTKKEAIYEDNEQTTEQLDEEFNIINKRLINVIMNKIKNKENGIAFCKSINEEIISETFVSQFLNCVMDSIPTLLENKEECYAMQTRGQLKNLRNMNMDKNKDTNKNKLLRNVEIMNKVEKKRGRPRKIIQEVKLQEPIKKRGRPRKVVNESPENDKKRTFIESEDESDSDDSEGDDFTDERPPRSHPLINLQHPDCLGHKKI